MKVLITLRGQQSIKVSIRPLPLLLGLSGLMAIPLGWAGSALYTLHQNQSQLSASAAEVLQELEELDAEVDQLRQRAGLPAKPSQASQPSVPGGKGGILIKPKAPTKLNITQQQLKEAKARLPLLNSRLQQQVKPALEKTLQQEADRYAAQPQGKPTKGLSPISSDFGLRPGPFGGPPEIHNGIDLLGEYGQPIYATAKGAVAYAGYDGGYGYHVILKHRNGYETLYAHLSKLAVTPKAKVQRGQLIGYMGSTGRSSGVHLHYTILRHQKAIDPKPYMLSERLSR
ncbi:MAG: M23 family metallopeptidase [Acaryochloridaceae cyanobacterium CSU_5_19]|nr:M23 family metallopeptidase [Acaryochloridaceae cyanobacterium CSU_5_19]